MPWWTMVVGEDLLVVNASPVNTSFGALGEGFRIPLISALNLISALGLAASGIIMLAYSFYPTKAYSKHLVGFAYRKPLYILIGFVAGLIISVLIVGSFGLPIPLFGSKTLTLPSNFTLQSTITTSVVTGFQLPFYLAIAATAFCLAARINHPHHPPKTEKTTTQS